MPDTSGPAPSPFASFVAVARFELSQRLHRVATWVYFGIFFALAFLFFIASAGAFPSMSLGTGGGKVLVNSPHTVTVLVQRISVYAVLVIAAIAGPAINQDFSNRTYAFVYTAPVSKAALVFGRFAGATAALALVHLSGPLACLVGSLMPFVDGSLIGPIRPLAYLGPFLLLLLPNVLVLGAIFFALGTLTRKMRAVYVTAVLLLLGYMIAGTLSNRIESKVLAALIDPFGARAFGLLTEYWTPAEKNARLIPLAGVLLGNRLIWSAVGVVAFLLAYRGFRPVEPLERAPAATPEPPVPAPDVPAAAAAPPTRDRWFFLSLWPRLTWLAARETMKNAGFLVILLAGVLFVVISVRIRGLVYGTETYPVTSEMLDFAIGGFGIFVLIIFTVYAGEISFREREARFDQIIDALPVPTWLLFAAKFGALLLVGLVLQLLAIACGVGVQIAQGYYRFELGLYFFDLLAVRMVSAFHILALALFLQVLLGHKQLGQFAMVVFYIASVALPLAGFPHPIYNYGAYPLFIHSAMNGYGHFLGPWAWFSLYWSFAAVGLLVLAGLLWPRGQETGWRQRLRLAVRRAGRGARVALALCVAGFVVTGGFLLWNTTVRNRYRTASDERALRASYERQLKAHDREPQPRLTGVKVHFDIWPAEHKLRVKGRYELTNKTGVPIPKVYALLTDEARVVRFALGGRAQPDARALDMFYTFALDPPLAPGASTSAEFELEFEARGFKHDGPSRLVLDNGTFINNHEALPQIGYQPGAELADDDDRKKQGLPPRPRMADLDDPAGRQRSYIARHADWISFAGSVCTSADQVAIIPGNLERQWQQTDDAGRPRRCSSFAPPGPILNFFSVLSARYAVKRDEWRDVAIEIYYHPGHEYNLERMAASIKASLDYFSRNFGPYQHKHVRIVEFPRYEQFAQGFPGTIPYSEGLGFIARVDPEDKRDVDYPYYITAHEVAHQWWANQVVGADVQGATLLSESLAQYSALMVMKATFGPGQMQRFLRYELDHYLRERAVERKKELPLLRVENQGYIHYRKASLVFYHLADALGEAVVNRALAALVTRYAFRGPPYPTARDLVEALRAHAPAEHRGLIADLLEHITLYENRALEARAWPVKAAPGQWELELKLVARKLRADEVGAETEVPIDHPIDVGAFGAGDAPVVLERRSLQAGEQVIRMQVGQKPLRAGIDPLSKLVDRKPGDNLIAVTHEEAEPSRGGR